MNEIFITTPDGKQPVQAHVKGGLAIHRTRGQKHRRYTITHIPSGLSIATKISSLGEARQKVEALLALWDFSKSEAEYMAEIFNANNGLMEKMKEIIPREIY